MLSPKKLKGKFQQDKCGRNPRHSVGGNNKNAKPLQDKKFFLDLKNHNISSKLEANLKTLGASIELFIGANVNYVVSDRHPAGPSSTGTTSPSPSAFTPSPSPSPLPSPSCLTGDSSAGAARPLRPPRSRAEAMLERVRTQTQHHVASHDPLDDARRWGIPILTLDKVLKFVTKQLNSIGSVDCLSQIGYTDNKVTLLRAPYIKFENINRRCRPNYKELSLWPSLNLDSTSGCPFVAPENGGDDGGGSRRRKRQNSENPFPQPKKISPSLNKSVNLSGLRSLAVTTRPNDTSTTTKQPTGAGRSDSTRMTRKARTRAATCASSTQQTAAGVVAPLLHPSGPGFCEACQISYSDHQRHLASDQHQRFANEDNNYRGLDALIARGGGFGRLLQCLNGSASPITPSGGDCRRKSPGDPTPPISPLNGHSHATRAQTKEVLNGVTLSHGYGTRYALSPRRRTPNIQTHHLRSRGQIHLPPSLIGTTAEDDPPPSRRSPEERKSIRRRSTIDEDNSDKKVRSDTSVPVTIECQKRLSDTTEETTRNIINPPKKRRSQLAVLSDEAESFMFGEPVRKSTDDEIDKKDLNSHEEKVQLPSHIDESSMDDTCSLASSDTTPIRRKRRTHAEKFIEDNREYYKFEVTGSRLRYHGTTLPHVRDDSPTKERNNQSNETEEQKPPMDVEEQVEENKKEMHMDAKRVENKKEIHMDAKRVENKKEIHMDAKRVENKKEIHLDAKRVEENKKDMPLDIKPSEENKKDMHIDSLSFSFESVPTGLPWFRTYLRQDRFEEMHYPESSYRRSFLLPYEVIALRQQGTNGSSLLNTSQSPIFRKRRRKGAIDKKSRKSPRCHASTLAILGGLSRRGRRSNNNTSLSDITEESPSKDSPTKKAETSTAPTTTAPTTSTPLTAPVHDIDSTINTTTTSVIVENFEVVPDVHFHEVEESSIPLEIQPRLGGLGLDLLSILDTYKDCQSLDLSHICDPNYRLPISDNISECTDSTEQSQSVPIRPRRRKKRKNLTGWPAAQKLKAARKRLLARRLQKHNTLNTSENVTADDESSNAVLTETEAETVTEDEAETEPEPEAKTPHPYTAERIGNNRRLRSASGPSIFTSTPNVSPAVSIESSSSPLKRGRKKKQPKEESPKPKRRGRIAWRTVSRR